MDNETNNVVALLHYHFVIPTKYKRKILSEVDPTLIEKAIRLTTKQDIVGIVFSVNVLPDHLDIEVSLPADIAPKSYVSKIKRAINPILEREIPNLHSRMVTNWSKSYFVETLKAPTSNYGRDINYYFMSLATSSRDKAKGKRG